MYSESDYIMLSALQHYAFCPRQCALIHKDQQWSENYLTTKGDLFHQRVDSYPVEKRKNLVTEFSISIRSAELGISGKTDIVEFYYAEGHLERIIPVEYKSGGKKNTNIDEVQLCAQAICLEEMMNHPVPIGFFFYGKDRKRLKVELTDELRLSTRKITEEIHIMLESELLPKPEKGARCSSCSLREVCRPDLFKKRTTPSKYIHDYLEDQTGDFI